MSGLPIRARLTAMFAAAMVAFLTIAALLLYVQLRKEFNETVNAGLVGRADAIAALVREGGSLRGDPGAGFEPQETFAQVLSDDGRVLETLGGVESAVLGRDELALARREPLVVSERDVDGIEDIARLRAQPVPRPPGTSDGEGSVVVVGQSLSDRNEVLSSLTVSFAVGVPLAVLVTSLIGYALATAGLRPVEAMRRRAAVISLSGEAVDWLPLPSAEDEIRRLGTTLNDMLDRMRRAFERERRFVADASHELRTPLAVLKTELESALRTGDYGPGVRESLLAAVEEADHLAQLAEDLLVLARAGEGRLPVSREPLDGRALLEGARDRFSDRAAEHGRRILVDAPDDLRVSGDPLRLRQVLGNLLDNALRHGAGDVTLTARPADGGVGFEISDRGPGFPDGFADRAFERFTRADDARSRGGAGLGLAIVSSIVDAHGGDIAVASGPGCTVSFWLPGERLAEDVPPSAAPRPAVAP